MKIITQLTFLCLILLSSNSYSANDFQIRLDTGIHTYKARWFENLSDSTPDFSSAQSDLYLGIAVHKPISLNTSFGSRIDIQEVNQHLLISVRAIDYQYAISEQFITNIFLGAARYQYRTPAYGYSTGLGLLYKPRSWGAWGLQLEARYFDTLARDKLTEDDPQDKTWGPDSFLDVQSVSFGVNYYF